MIGAWAIVPVKCFARGKSRLGDVLDEAAREDLARSLCDHVLSVLAAVGPADGIAGTIVATDCPGVERHALSLGAEVVRDGSVRALSAIVDGALGVLGAKGARAALVLMSDLPLLAPDEVRALVAALDGAPVVLGPDRRDEGTNALGLAPPNGLATCFGTVGSFAYHRARAEAAGLSVAVVRREGVACDLDSPEDLAFVRAYADRGARFRWKRNRSSRVSAA